MVTTHRLPEAVFASLAEGDGGPDTIRQLRDAQQSKHLMLLFAIADEATGADRGATAFRAGYELLGRLQSADSGASAWLLDLPHLGGWTHDCLIKLDRGATADFGHFASMVAAAAVRIGMPFELDVPARDGRVLLPGLGFLRINDETAWIRLRCGGDRVTAGDYFTAEWRLLIPDDGSGQAVSLVRNTPGSGHG